MNDAHVPPRVSNGAETPTNAKCDTHFCSFCQNVKDTPPANKEAAFYQSFFLVPATLSLNRSKNCTVISLRGVRQGRNCIGLNHPCELPNRTSSWSLQVWLVVLVAYDLLADLVCAIFFWWFQLMNKHMSQWVQSL